MATAFLTHARLDRLLSRLARRPERFALDSASLAAALAARRLELEISDPDGWRGARDPARVPAECQLETEIGSLRPIDCEEELRLARRIEFARIRLDHALAEQGLGRQERSSGTNRSPSIRRCRQEWHALRLEMVERNLHLVLIHVERYSRFTGDRADLIQTAAAALFRAVDGFDWRRGVRFQTYAVHWLRLGFRSQLYESGRTVRVPPYLLKSVKHVNAAIQRLGDPHASVEEIAHESGLRPGRIASARQAARRIRSLDAPLDSFDDTRTLASELAWPGEGGSWGSALEDISLECGVAAALARLDPHERLTVELRFGIGRAHAHSLAEIAAELGVGLRRVRQIIARAFDKLRTPRLRRLLEPLIS
jgi:RNA polymerase sigma factor (sigma-70 family)